MQLTASIRRLRAYLAAGDLDHTEAAGGVAVLRTPFPLPRAVRVVATALLGVFGALSVAGSLFVLGSGIAVVVMPLAMGRTGVGTAMITLFLCCVVVVLSGVSLLSARSAARVLRRERASVRSLGVLSLCGALVSAAATGVAWWLAAAFLDSGGGMPRLSEGTTLLVLGVPVVAFMFFSCCATVLRRYHRGLLERGDGNGS